MPSHISRKRIIVSGLGTAAYYSNRSAELTKQGANWWDHGFPARNEVMDAIKELSTELGRSIEVTYKGRTISKIYPDYRGQSRDPEYYIPQGVTGLFKEAYKIAQDTWSDVFRVDDLGTSIGHLEHYTKIRN